MCKSLTNYFPRNNDFLVTYFGKTQIIDECYNLESEMGDLARYFDYEAFGRDLFMYDYSMGANNNVFRVI